MVAVAGNNFTGMGYGDGGGMQTKTGESFHDQQPGMKGVKDGWVLYALHPKRGRFVVNEGVVLVGDQKIVCRGA